MTNSRLTQTAEPGKPPLTTRATIVAMHADGLRACDIARMVGYTPAGVSMCLKRHREGVPEKPKAANRTRAISHQTTAAYKLRMGNLPIGEREFRSVLMQLPEPVIDWLHAECGGDVTIAAMVRAIIIDAHADATDA